MYLGSVTIGQAFNFRMKVDPVMEYAYYDVRRTADGVVILLDQEIAFQSTYGSTLLLASGSIDTATLVGGLFVFYPDEQYTIVLKQFTGILAPGNWDTYVFDIKSNPVSLAPSWHLGTAIKGGLFSFMIRNPDGYTKFDVLRNATDTVITSNSSLFPHTGYDTAVCFGSIDTSAAGYAVGEEYTIVVKDKTGNAPNRKILLSFRVEHSFAGKLDWIRNDTENVLFPRTDRILAHFGERILIDNVTVDSANNMTAMRVRLFKTSAAAAAATPGLDDVDLPESGEIHVIYVTQTFDLPRCVRSVHRSFVGEDYIPADEGVTENTATSPVLAPGNTGTYPS